jgi:AraC-like DNA-binding protein
MNIIQYILPAANEQSIVVQEDILPYAYNTLHRHKESQITLIVKGSGTFILGNSTTAFQAGDIYIIGADQPHYFQSSPHYFEHIHEENTHAIHIFFDHQRIQTAIRDLPEFCYIAEFLGFAQSGVKIPAPLASPITDKIWLIKNSPGFDRFIHLLLLLQCCAVNSMEWELLSCGLSTCDITRTEKLRMNAVYQYTLEHFCEDISLTQVASIACLTTHSFCKYFKKRTRKTYVTFLNEVRINEACKKILSNDYDNIYSIAYATGFNNAITFNRVFKKITGKCPTEYIHQFKSTVK